MNLISQNEFKKEALLSWLRMCRIVFVPYRSLEEMDMIGHEFSPAYNGGFQFHDCWLIQRIGLNYPSLLARFAHSFRITALADISATLQLTYSCMEWLFINTSYVCSMYCRESQNKTTHPQISDYMPSGKSRCLVYGPWRNQGLFCLPSGHAREILLCTTCVLIMIEVCIANSPHYTTTHEVSSSINILDHKFVSVSIYHSNP